MRSRCRTCNDEGRVCGNASSRTALAVFRTVLKWSGAHVVEVASAQSSKPPASSPGRQEL